jgi:hypothetical protein
LPRPKRASLANRDPYGAEKLFPPAPGRPDDGPTEPAAPAEGSADVSPTPAKSARWEQRFKRWTVHIERRTLTRLEKAARNTGRSKADLTSSALDEYLRGLGF